MVTYDVLLVRRVQASGTAPTFTALSPIKYTALTVMREIGAPGMLDVTSTVDALDATAKAALLDLSATPCEVWCYRDGELIHAGPLTNYRIRGRAIAFSSPGLLAYVSYMVRTTAYTASATDQATIVKALIDAHQALTYGNFGLDTSSLTATGVTRDLALNASDLKHLDAVIAEMGGRANGFDLEVDPATRDLLMHSPRQGADVSATVIIDGRSIDQPQYGQSVGPGQIASDVVVSSGSATGVTLTSSASDAGVRATFGRAMLTASFSDVSVQATLDEHATRLRDDNNQPLHTIATNLLAVPNFEYGDFGPGDIVTYEYDAGLGLQSFTPRVRRLAVSMNAGTERFTVEFV